jgi:hypothetical protein
LPRFPTRRANHNHRLRITRLIEVFAIHADDSESADRRKTAMAYDNSKLTDVAEGMRREQSKVDRQTERNAVRHEKSLENVQRQHDRIVNDK